MYTADVFEVLLGSQVDMSSTGIKGRTFAGMSPLVIRNVVFINDNTGGQVAVAKCSYGTTPLSSGGGTVAATINIPNALAAAKGVYKTNLNAKVSPCQEIIFDVTTAMAAGDKGSMVILVERLNDAPGNTTALQATT